MSSVASQGDWLKKFDRFGKIQGKNQLQANTGCLTISCAIHGYEKVRQATYESIECEQRSLPPRRRVGVAGLMHEPFANALSPSSHTDPLGVLDNAQREEKIYI